MRSLAGLPLLCVLSSTATAEIVPVRPFTVGVAFVGHGGAVDGVPEGGIGPGVELAYGWNRTQLFVEGGIAWVSRGPTAAREAGTQVRGALGARWIARSFDLERVGLDMTLDATAGAHRFTWADDSTLVRPEIAGGFGLQMRKYHRPHVSIRFGVRVFFAPHDRDPDRELARTSSPMPSAPLTNGGLMVTIGVSL